MQCCDVQFQLRILPSHVMFTHRRRTHRFIYGSIIQKPSNRVVRLGKVGPYLTPWLLCWFPPKPFDSWRSASILNRPGPDVPFAPKRWRCHPLNSARRQRLFYKQKWRRQQFTSSLYSARLSSSSTWHRSMDTMTSFFLWGFLREKSGDRACLVSRAEEGKKWTVDDWTVLCSQGFHDTDVTSQNSPIFYEVLAKSILKFMILKNDIIAEEKIVN